MTLVAARFLAPRAQPLGGRGGPDPPKFGRTTPTFYVAALCSARNWLYHPYFVLYNNLDQGIGPPNFENVVAPLSCSHLRSENTR